MIGAQWGDEGKGKIVDWLASRADVVVRFQGGHNAGHTLVVGNTTYKLSLLPSGIVTGTLSIIGNGVVLDPWALKAEIERLEGQGVRITPENLVVADNCPLILPIHTDLDVMREAAAGKGKIGTTGRGIGPAYEDKVGRRAVRVCDLAHLHELEPQLDRLCAHHDALRAGFGQGPVDRAALLDKLREIAPFVQKYAQPVWLRLREERRKGSRILFEGAQGVLLDVDHGTYPFVTSSNTVSGTVASGTGLGPGAAGFVLGIVKAYTTRVGSGPFPSELEDADGQRLGERGHEFGTVTGRPRRIGWFDSAVARYSARLNGIGVAALMRLDILDEQPELKICTAYKFRGATHDHPIANISHYKHCVPIYEEMPGWKAEIGSAKVWDDLPQACREYVQRVGDLIGVPVDLIGTGPRRDQFVTRGRRLFD